MKKLIICLFVSCGFFITSWSQDLLGFENIAGNDRMDYKKAETKALEVSSFLLTTPVDISKEERDKAVTFMLMWMEGTPDYVYYIDENVNYFTHSSKALLSIYLAGMAKLSLEDPVLAKNQNEIKYRSMELFIDYCTNPSNHVKTYRQLEQLIKARERGRLKEYIKN